MKKKNKAKNINTNVNDDNNNKKFRKGLDLHFSQKKHPNCERSNIENNWKLTEQPKKKVRKISKRYDEKEWQSDGEMETTVHIFYRPMK